MPSRRHASQAAPLAALLLAVLAAAALPAAAASGQAASDPPAAAEAPPPAATVSSPAVEVAPPLPLDTIVVRPRPEAPTISLSLREADLVEVLRSFARIGGFDLVVDPAVQGTVTVELRDVRWQDALVVILRSHGLAAEVNGRIVGVRPLPLAAPR